MAFTDDTTGGRVIECGMCPMKVTLGEAVEVGDIISYASGWKRADASTLAESDVRLVAGTAGASAAIITAYFAAHISGITTGTAGNPVYLSETDGEYTGTAPTTAAAAVMVVGYELGDSDMFICPSMGYLDTCAIGVGSYIVGGSSTGGGYSLRALCTTGTPKVIEIGGSTSAKGKIAFFGDTLTGRQAHIASTTAAGATTINAILVALETYGLIATA